MQYSHQLASLRHHSPVVNPLFNPQFVAPSALGCPHWLKTHTGVNDNVKLWSTWYPFRLLWWYTFQLLFTRIIQQNVNFQQVYDYRRMIELTYLSPEETDSDAKFILLQEVMKRLERSFPNFVIGKSTDKEIGRKLSEMGYEHKRQNKGAVYRIKER